MALNITVLNDPVPYMSYCRIEVLNGAEAYGNKTLYLEGAGSVQTVTTDRAGRASFSLPRLTQDAETFTITATDTTAASVTGTFTVHGGPASEVMQGKLYVSSDYGTMDVVYEVGEIYSFFNPILKPGFVPCNGTLIEGAAEKYPEAWAEFQKDGWASLRRTEAEWQTQSRSSWGAVFKDSWNGIGGVPYIVQDLAAGTLRVPDFRGMFRRSGTPGEITGDTVRSMWGRIGQVVGAPTGAVFVETPHQIRPVTEIVTDFVYKTVAFETNRIVPSGVETTPKSWGSLTAIYLGVPR